MCDAAVPATRPLKLTCTRIVLAMVSRVTVVNPVPGEAFGGLSAGPLRLATNVSTSAREFWVAPTITIASTTAMNTLFTDASPSAEICVKRGVWLADWKVNARQYICHLNGDPAK